ncbi:MAG: hypothetical protein ABI591_00730 [Kofleriaceae bacterium]
MARKVRPRDEARTTEFDCRGIAVLLDAQDAARRPAPVAPDLEAEIEIATSSLEPSITRGPSRLAHTMRRPGAELARGSQPMVVTPEEPPIVEVKPPANATATTPMPVLLAEILVHGSTLIPDRMRARREPRVIAGSTGVWWIVGTAAVVVSGLALLAALTYL